MNRAEQNRQLMPNVAAIIDEYREFFPGLKVIYAEDLVTGHSVGRKPEPEPNTYTIPEGFRPSRSMQEIEQEIAQAKREATPRRRK